MSLLRDVLWLPGGDQSPDEDGPEHGPRWSRQLPAGRLGARGGAEAHQPAQAGTGDGVRRLQRLRHDLWPRGTCTDWKMASALHLVFSLLSGKQ